MIVTTTHDYETNTYKFAWACSTKGCGVLIQRHSRSVNIDKQCCGKCRGRLIEIEVPGRSRDLKNANFTPKKKKELSGFSLFVQKHARTVRKRMVAEASDKER